MQWDQPLGNGKDGAAAREADASLEIHLLGVTDYESCLALQRRLVFELDGQRDGKSYLIVCEHPPLITVGRQGSWAHFHCECWELISRQLPVRWINRGGGCLVHGPGQLAVYPVIPLSNRSWGLAEYTRRLGRCLLELAEEFDVKANVAGDGGGIMGRHGVFAFLGMAVKDWISYHGFFLNVCPDPLAQRLVRPMPLVENGSSAAGRVSSLAIERGRPVRMDAVREAAVRLLAKHLEFDRYYVYAGHHLLRPMRQPDVVVTGVG